MIYITKYRFLLGKNKSALEIVDEAIKYEENDWELHYNKGLVFAAMKQYDEALECFNKSLNYSKNEKTYIQIANIYMIKNNFQAAIKAYEEARKNSLESQGLLNKIGFL